MNQPPWFWDKSKPIEYFLLLSDFKQMKILLVKENNRWGLPHFTPKYTESTKVQYIVKEVNNILGADTIFIRCARHRYDPVLGQQDRVYVLNILSDKIDSKIEHIWAGRDYVERLIFEIPDHQEIIRNWFMEYQSANVPDMRVPWANVNWHSDVLTWISDRLVENKFSMKGPVTQMKTWPLSNVLSVETSRGKVYFKAPAPFMNIEAKAIKQLSEYYPDIVPKPIALDEDLGWTLTKDYGSTYLQNISGIEIWEGAARVLADFHKSNIPRVEEWLALGYPDRNLRRLVIQVDPLISLGAAMLGGVPWGLSEENISNLRSLSMRLKLMCAQLSSYKVPHTLIHGDIGGNVVFDDMEFRVFDWTDICISHPFFDLTTFVDTIFDPLNKEIDVLELKEKTKLAYLQEWVEYEPMERLLEAYEISKTLGPLHQAATYAWIVTNCSEDSRFELGGGLALWLKNVLRSV